MNELSGKGQGKVVLLSKFKVTVSCLGLRFYFL